MNVVKQYRREIKRLLLCSGKKRKKLLSELDGMIDIVQNDHADLDKATLEKSLGKPIAVSEMLMSDVSAEEKARFQKRKRFLQIASIALLCVAAILITIMIWRDKELSTIHSEVTIIIHEEIPSTTTIHIP